ncbi:MAG: Xaa-Pro peptidase family protein [Proteobacteria bacterium]|nr:Xaa-Pro peptidase family protein [Pseudomonadota bacterium]MBU4257892.1 Xaa-Pro peptidase family protein [Pseudomonadota bacterium]MBU4288865.1 Xaa-Pro peptidase family protein [Pseudomonadota bacterium]MBU4415402.1 Xaa-Pro peptidase family protein [Pseudomonadota bacterium]MCG2757295.1 Xaa-Pro peptidase family protein [Desulfobacteraceae bacterium]
MKKTIEKRVERLRKSLAENNIDTLMVLVEENRRYLSGFTGEDTQFDETAGALFITDQRLMLVTDSRNELQAANEAPLYEIISYKKGLTKELPNIINTLKTKRLGFESIRMSYMQYNKICKQFGSSDIDVELVEADNIMECLRIVKEQSELEEIKKALLIAESVFMNFVENTIEPGMTEKEAAWLLEKNMREAGADSVSFPIIVASGPNSALPHAIPGNRKFKKDEPILFDWGAKLNGYCSDITRTIVIGSPDDRFKKIFKTVLDAQNKAINAIKPGISSKAVDEVARDHIGSMGFKGKFGHGLGHGIGLAVHEPPKISPLKDTLLESHMVFTVEPGIYIPGWGGIRIENMVVVSENGAKVLNSLDPLMAIRH